MNEELKIREAQLEDAPRLVEIYSYYVLKTAVSFEYKVPTVDEFKERIRKIKTKFPYLVCEKNGVIAGYVYANTYSEREAYNWTVSSSIYIDKDFRRQGIGSLLYANLEEKLQQLGIRNILAGVAFIEKEDEYLTNDSSKFHKKMGYEKVAQFKEIGKKFDRWYDLIWMQKKI